MILPQVPVTLLTVNFPSNAAPLVTATFSRLLPAFTYLWAMGPETSLPNESQLLQQVAAGEESAFTTIFHHWQPRLASFLFRLTGSKELTEELLLDIFLKLWQQKSRLGEVQNFSSYIFTLSKNHALNELEKLQTRLRHERSFGQMMLASAAAEHGKMNEEEKRNMRLIDSALQQLPERQRQVWIMSRLERLTYKEIAEKIGVSPETVKTHLKLATTAITQFIKDHEFILLLMSSTTAALSFS